MASQARQTGAVGESAPSPADSSTTARVYDKLAARWQDGELPATYGLKQHRHALKFHARAPGWALHVGCGASTRFNPLLRRHRLMIEGVDVSMRMLALAQAADPASTLHHADICDWPIPRAYRFISAWDSLWHVPLAKQRGVMLKLMAALAPGGVFIFSAGGTDSPHEHTDASMGAPLYYATLGVQALVGVVREGDCVLKHLEFDQMPEAHLYCIVQKPA